MRRYDEPIHLNQRYVRRPGAYAILVRGPQILLTYQSDPFAEIQLPGGGIDPGETPIQALHREVFEETGHRMTNVRRLGAYQRYTYMPDYDLWAHKICHIYLGRPARRVSEPPEPLHSVVWTLAKDAPDLIASAGDRQFLRDFLKSRG